MKVHIVIINRAYNFDLSPLLQQRKNRQRSPGITDIAEDFQESDQIGACTSVSDFQYCSHAEVISGVFWQLCHELWCQIHAAIGVLCIGGPIV